MKKVAMSDDAYIEFKEFLKSNDIDSDVIRINFGGNGPMGPMFYVTAGEKNEGDEVEAIKDLTFVIDSSLIDVFLGFSILSDEENFGEGLTLDPLMSDYEGGGCSGNCGSCGSCH